LVAQEYTALRDEPGMKTPRNFSAFMTNGTESPLFRRLACSRCGAEFDCDPSGSCWCKYETLRLPMPVAGENCLCRNCLRKAAEQVGRKPAA
jgi:hypothetical protein